VTARTRRGRRASISMVTACGLLLCACSSGGSGTTPGSSDATTTTAAPVATTTTASTARAGPAIPAGSVYAALGSSFAAGPGIPKQSGGACARSDHNYAHLVAQRLQLQLVDVSCSGATTADLLDRPQDGNPPQIDAVTSSARLVSVTIGGNDIDYTAATIACGARATDCVPSLDTTAMDAALAALPGRLAQVFAAIRRRAPGATIVLVTYPEVVAAGPASCAALHLDAAAASYLHGLGQRLEAVFVAAARSDGTVLVDAYTASAGHGPCAPAGQSWVDGEHATVGFPYHPNRTGHAAIAALVVDALTKR